MRNLLQLISRVAVVATIAGMATVAATPTQAAINKGTGDIAGVAGDLTDSLDFVLNSTTLKLVKRAFLADGTPIASGSSVPTGTTVKFIIYVNNNTPVPIDDVSIQDVLAASFAYTANSIKIDNTTTCALEDCTALEEDAIFAAIDDNAPLTDAAAAGDVGSYDGTDTIDIGNSSETNNDQLDILASSVFAVQITVTMQ